MIAPSPSPADCGFPHKELDILHRKAVRLSGVMNAIGHLTNQGACREGQETLIFLAEELAQDLHQRLDQLSNSGGAQR